MNGAARLPASSASPPGRAARAGVATNRCRAGWVPLIGYVWMRHLDANAPTCRGRAHNPREAVHRRDRWRLAVSATSDGEGSRRLADAQGARSVTSCQKIGVYRPILIALAALLSSDSANARDDAGSDWLESYAAVRGCPDASVFRAAVRERVALPVAQALAGVRLAVDIRADGADGEQSWVGRLSTHAEGTVTTRTLRASSCAGLVEALSLVATLSAQGGRGGPEGVAPLSAPPSAEARLDGEPRDQGAPVATEAPPDATRIGPTALLLLQNAATPGFEVGVGLGLAVSLPARGVWSPWFQAGGYRVQSGPVPIDGGQARAEFDLIAAYAVGCPVRLALSHAASLQPCVDLDLGRLRGSGAGTELTRSSTRGGWWASTGLALRAEATPVGPLRLSASWGPVLPWTRHEFFFSPDTVAFRVPPLAWRGGLSGALVF
jgi:hypothetical protein